MDAFRANVRLRRLKRWMGKRRRGRSGGGASRKVNDVVGFPVLRAGRQVVVDLIGTRFVWSACWATHSAKFSRTIYCRHFLHRFPTSDPLLGLTHQPPSIVRAHVSTSLVRMTCYRKRSQHVCGSNSRMKSGRSSFWRVSKCTHL